MLCFFKNTSLLISISILKQTGWLYCVECPQYSIWLEALGCLCSVICRVTYLQFPIQACFSSAPVSQAAQGRHSGVLGLPNIGHQTSQKICEGFLYGAYRSGEWLWIDFNVKKLINSTFPKRDHLVVNFRRSIISAEVWTREHRQNAR